MHIRMVMLPIVYAWLASGARGFDLAGNWHLSGLSLPSNTAQHVDTDGIVIGLTGNNTFDANDGDMTIGPTGTVSGYVGGAIAGTASVDSNGLATLSLTIPEPMTLTFHVSYNSDVMTGSHSGADNHELLVMTKNPGAAVAADAVGTWWVLELETPAGISLIYNGDGKATGISNPTGFRQSRASLVIDGGGNYNYNSGEELGTVAVAANGTMTLTPEDPLVSGLQFHMNSLKDVMITANGDSTGRNLIILVKSHEVRNWEATGRWAMNSATLPESLTMSVNVDDLIVQINGLDELSQASGYIDFAITGGLSGFHENVFSGYSTGSSNGLINIYHGDPAPLSAAVNIGGDFFVAVQGYTGSNDLMMLLGVRSVRPFALAVLPASPAKIVWVPGAGRVLQESTLLSNWQAVPGSETTSFHEPDQATSGNSHFYRLYQP